ncbi:MAG: tetratricopeptide repeat protein [Nitrospira sp.]|nr:MAG: tetratricopeptide repeat protein [Nitrospira sp.]
MIRSGSYSENRSPLLEAWLSPSPRWYHAPCYYQEDAVDLDAFKQMVAKNPKGFLGRYGLGNKLIQEDGNLEEAVEHLTVATQLDPTHVASHLHLGRALISLGRKNDARPVLQAGIEAARSGRSNGGGDLVPEMETLLRTIA